MWKWGGAIVHAFSLMDEQKSSSWDMETELLFYSTLSASLHGQKHRNLKGPVTVPRFITSLRISHSSRRRRRRAAEPVLDIHFFLLEVVHNLSEARKLVKSFHGSLRVGIEALSQYFRACGHQA